MSKVPITVKIKIKSKFSNKKTSSEFFSNYMEKSSIQG